MFNKRNEYLANFRSHMCRSSPYRLRCCLRHLHSIHSCQRWLHNSFHSRSRGRSFCPLASRFPLYLTLVLLCRAFSFLNHPLGALIG